MATTGNLFDYLYWRGDVTFSQSPFNDADNLVFCLLTYCVFDNLATEEENKNGITVKEYYDRLVKNGGYPEGWDILCTIDQLKSIAETKRFGSVIIKNYVTNISATRSIQFSAMNFCFGKKEHYIGFRGTDDSIAGWKEDLLLTCRKVPAQKLARDYLKDNLVKEETYYVGGHSKGGHLAIYGAVNLTKEEQDLISLVYTNDAPGFCKEVMDPEKLMAIDKKAKRIVPCYSIIGMTFECPFTNLQIVDSTDSGPLQHDIRNWQIEKDHLSIAEELDPQAQFIDKAIKSAFSDVDIFEREKLVNELFAAINEDGKAVTLSSVRNGGVLRLERVLVMFAEHHSAQSNQALRKVPVSLFFGKAINKVKKVNFLQFFIQHPNLPVGIFLILSGIVFLFIKPAYFSYYIGAFFIIAALGETVMLISSLIASNFKIKGNLLTIYTTLILYFLAVAFFTSFDSLKGFASVLFGVILLAISFRITNRIVNRGLKNDIFGGVISIIESVCCFIQGFYFIVVNNYDVEWIFYILGCLTIAFGILRIILCITHFFQDEYKKHKAKKTLNEK